MKKITLAVFTILLLVSHSVFSDEYKEIEDSGITFQWKLEGDSLYIRLSAPTEGWVAVGFNPSKVMKGADYKLAYVEGSETFIEDHFGTGLFGHKSDLSIGGQSNFTLISGSESGGVTTVEFSIPLNSGDEYDTVLNRGDEVKVLLAYGSRDNFSRKHKKRTSVVIEL